MKTIARSLCIIAIVTFVGPAAVMAGESQPATSPSENVISVAPVSCRDANAVSPIIIAAESNPCPGKVYCNNPNTTCGEYCCEWGYFYSTSCDCKCYRNSSDASAASAACGGSYFRCN